MALAQRAPAQRALAQFADKLSEAAIALHVLFKMTLIAADLC